MNVLDTGRLTLTAGTKTIDFRNCMIFMTSNVGAQAAQQYLENSAIYRKNAATMSEKVPTQQIIEKSCSASSIMNFKPD